MECGASGAHRIVVMRTGRTEIAITASPMCLSKYPISDDNAVDERGKRRSFP
jgi:hypothetical protein